MRIAVDAMGSDARPVPDVEGAVMAAQETQSTILLIGDEKRIQQELTKYDIDALPIEIVHAPDEILMTDRPSVAAKEKTGSAMHIGMGMIKNNTADAFVTAGNTGAAHAIAMLHTLRRIPGVKRPALSVIFPIKGKRIIFLDVGANADCKAEWLAQFAIMGDIYAQKALGLPAPCVGLLSNGEEEGKGSQLIRETDLLIQQLNINYIGNIEPEDIHHGRVDVVVTDGFTGNILLKTFESSTRYLVETIREELRYDFLTSLGAWLARPAFRRVRKQIDPNEVGGAPLLGVDGVVIIAHGNTTAYGIKNAIVQAQKAVEGNIIQSIQDGLGALTIVK